MRPGKINTHIMKAFIEKKYIWEKSMDWKIFYESFFKIYFYNRFLKIKKS